MLLFLLILKVKFAFKNQFLGFLELQIKARNPKVTTRSPTLIILVQPDPKPERLIKLQPEARKSSARPTSNN